MLLSAASQRQDHLLALPETLKGRAAQALVSKLLARRPRRGDPSRPADPHWRTGEDDQLIGLRITPAGLQAIGVEPERRCLMRIQATRRRPAAANLRRPRRRIPRSRLRLVRSGRARSVPW